MIMKNRIQTLYVSSESNDESEQDSANEQLSEPKKPEMIQKLMIKITNFETNSSTKIRV